MTKSIFKEIIIVLLLCLAIILVLGIVLYEYVPTSKTVPNQVAYTTPEEVQQELLEASGVDESEIVMTYEVNGDDLNNYKRVHNYKPGKANPFSSFEEETEEGKENTTNSNTTATTGNAASGNGTTQSGENNGNGGSVASGGNNSSQGNSSGSSSSGGQFFQDKGTK